MDPRTGTVLAETVPKDASPQRIRMDHLSLGSSGQKREAVRETLDFQRTDHRGRTGSAQAAAPFFFLWRVEPLPWKCGPTDAGINGHRASTGTE